MINKGLKGDKYEIFKTNDIRQTVSLNGLWKAKKETGEEFDLYVPGCWENVPGLERYRGKMEYTRKINICKMQNLRFVFKGVSHTADVYFDGEKIAHHYNAYTPFDVPVANVKEGEHELTLLVDNSFSKASALHKDNDYYTYGGITRPAGYEIISDAYIKNIHFTPLFKDGKWCGTAETEIHNISDKSFVCDLEIEIADKKEILKNIETSPYSVYKNKTTFAFENIAEWSCENPQLYNITCRLCVDGNCIDDLKDQCEFRTIEVRGKDIVLNGKKVFLKGFNQHEDHPAVDCAIPCGLIMQDIRLMKDMGANAVRTCHYPNDERFLDICDELGILVWEENHARGLRINDMKNPNFEKQCEDCIDEMIYNHYNHPSIIIWAILNECASADHEGREMYKNDFFHDFSFFIGCDYFDLMTTYTEDEHWCYYSKQFKLLFQYIFMPYTTYDTLTFRCWQIWV